MWILIYLLLLLLFIACVLLFAPFYFEVNSLTGALQVRFWVLASIRVSMEQDTLLCKLRVLGRRFQMDVLHQRKVKVEKKVRNRKATTRRPKRLFRRLLAIAKTFRVNQCVVSVDSGNMQTNALLYPAFYWLSRLSGLPLAINFSGDEVVVLEIENNIARMLWALIRN